MLPRERQPARSPGFGPNRSARVAAPIRGSSSGPRSWPASSSPNGSTGEDMHTQGTDGRQTHGLGAAVKEVAERASAIVRLELELAAMEVKRKVVALGLGIGFA